MHRVLPGLAAALCALSLSSLSACAGGYDVELAWTIDGREPATACDALPAGTDILFTILSQDGADDRVATVTETTTTAQCNAGAATVQTGPFASILAELVDHTDGDVTIGTAAAVDVAPGGPDQGFSSAVDDDATIDFVVTRSNLQATLTVVGVSCGDAGASSFTVTLFENPEPRALVPVAGAVDVDVACTDGVAVFKHSGLVVGQRYAIQASASGGDYVTPSSGEGFVATGAATFTTIDLEAR